MDRNRSELKAGIVIVAGVALTVVILVAAGRLGDLFEKKQRLHVYFTDVQGLKIDDPVLVMGLEKGKVAGMKVTRHADETGQMIPMVEIIAKVASEEPFGKDSKITVDRSLTGNTALKIEPGRGDPLGEGEMILGLSAVPLSDLANKAGVMAKRLDDFLADLTDRNIVGAIRASMLNLKQVSEDARKVSGSLSHSIPTSEAGIVSSIKNLDEMSGTLNHTIQANKSKLTEMITGLHSTTQSIANSATNVDQILIKSKDRITTTVANIEKATANIKTLTREVRWQPWVLLNKPDEVEIKERSVYNSALEFSEGAETLNSAVKELSVVAASADSIKEQKEKYRLILEQIHQNLDKISGLERKLWTDLNTRAEKKGK